MVVFAVQCSIIFHCCIYVVQCQQWVPEITHHCQKTPFLLVGTQIDLRDDAGTVEKLAKNKQKPITVDMGEKLARELRAVKYVECSALTQVCSFSCLLLPIKSLPLSSFFTHLVTIHHLEISNIII